MSEYCFDDSEEGYGRVFIPRTPWKSGYRDIVEREGVKVVRLSASMGWEGPSVDFLGDFPSLLGVEIYAWDVRDASIINSLSELRLVGVECNLRKPIDFSALPHIQVVKATWNRALGSVLHCSGLKRLNLTNWPEEDLEPLSAMVALGRLQLTSRRLKSLRGLSASGTLEWLDFHACPKLENLDELRTHTHIRRLELTSCKSVNNLSAIGALAGC